MLQSKLRTVIYCTNLELFLGGLFWSQRVFVMTAPIAFVNITWVISIVKMSRLPGATYYLAKAPEMWLCLGTILLGTLIFLGALGVADLTKDSDGDESLPDAKTAAKSLGPPLNDNRSTVWNTFCCGLALVGNRLPRCNYDRCIIPNQHTIKTRKYFCF